MATTQLELDLENEIYIEVFGSITHMAEYMELPSLSVAEMGAS